MSYITRKIEAERDMRFVELQRKKLQAKSVVEAWMNDATALYGDSPTQTEKDEVLAERDTLVADLRAILGV